MDSGKLIEWYRANGRDLPWRRVRDPYRIWLSEVMLQQTTVAAVIPYYERFIDKFPDVQLLAAANLEDVLELWAGLGYYSRAKLLHRAAQHIARVGFPKTSRELAELPGFGPYTSRSVASLAFGEKVGVLDGNVIRVLSRRYGLHLEWWKPDARRELQSLADRLAIAAPRPQELNQGLMDLGATICTPKSPACLLCPWTAACIARRSRSISELPLKRPRRAREIWKWNPVVIEHKGRILLVDNNYAPFLKGHWILPGKATRISKPPAKFLYKGTVTHHDIFVHPSRGEGSGVPVLDSSTQKRWVNLDRLAREVPASLIRKAIERVHDRSQER